MGSMYEHIAPQSWVISMAYFLIPFCGRCYRAAKIISHFLMESMGLREIWSYPLPPIFPHLLNTIWCWVFSAAKEELRWRLYLVVMVICSKSWKVWIKKVHSSLEWLLLDIIVWPKEFLDIYQVAQGSWLTPVAVVLLSTWRPPDREIIKINVDVALSGRFGVYSS